MGKRIRSVAISSAVLDFPVPDDWTTWRFLAQLLYFCLQDVKFINGTEKDFVSGAVVTLSSKRVQQLDHNSDQYVMTGS